METDKRRVTGVVILLNLILLLPVAVVGQFDPTTHCGIMPKTLYPASYLDYVRLKDLSHEYKILNDSNCPGDLSATAEHASDEWETVSLEFTENSSAASYVMWVAEKENGCDDNGRCFQLFSSDGRITEFWIQCYLYHKDQTTARSWGYDINDPAPNLYATLVHEFGHAIGLVPCQLK